MVAAEHRRATPAVQVAELAGGVAGCACPPLAASRGCPLATPLSLLPAVQGRAPPRRVGERPHVAGLLEHPAAVRCSVCRHDAEPDCGLAADPMVLLVLRPACRACHGRRGCARVVMPTPSGPDRHAGLHHGDGRVSHHSAWLQRWCWPHLPQQGSVGSQGRGEGWHQLSPAAQLRPRALAAAAGRARARSNVAACAAAKHTDLEGRAGRRSRSHPCTSRSTTETQPQ